MTNGLEFELCTTIDELDALQPEWNELLQRSSANNVFLTWEWLSCWWECLSRDRVPWVLSAREPGTGRLLGVTPLAFHRQSSRKGLQYRVLTFMGSIKAAPDHLDFIVDATHEAEVMQALVDKLLSMRDQWDMLSLAGLAANSPLCHMLADRSGYRQVFEEVCPYITLPADWETYEMTLSRNMRSDTRRKARRLEKAFPDSVSYRQVSCESEVQDALSTLFHLHGEVRQTHGQAGAFVDEEMCEFHRKVAPLFLKNGWLRHYQIMVEGETIGMLYCFLYNRVLSYYQSGYDPEWNRHSPGSLIIAHAIQQGIAEGAVEFDFLRGAEPYKFKWTEQVRHTVDVEYAPGFVRRVHELYLNVDKRIRSVQKKLQLGLGLEQ